MKLFLTSYPLTDGFVYLLLVCSIIGPTDGVAQDSGDSPHYGSTLDNQRFSPLNEINTGNIWNLELSWRFRTGKKATFQTSSIVIDGIMYITTPYSDVIALHADTGNLMWRYKHRLEAE